MFYSVYAPKSGVDDKKSLSHAAVNRLKFIAEKNSLWAFIFPYFWLIYHGLWWEFLGYSIYMALPIFVAQQGASDFALILTYLPALYLFLEGSAIRAAHLERQSWQHLATLEAENEHDAAFKFLNLYQAPIRPMSDETINQLDKTALTRLEQAQQQSTALTHKTPTPAFGLFD